MAALALAEIGPFQSQTQAKKNINQAIKNVASHLGNRPATCRKYYVHPAILDAYLDGSLLPTLEKIMPQPTADSPYALSPEEMAVVAILEQQLEAQQPVAS
ncbi:MAG TPA: hypothetical protein V6D04_05545 [Candidatus Obscuribacterales bacterium]